VATEKGQLDVVLQALWEWAKKVLTPEELNSNMFLKKDGDERTAWHMVSEKGQIELLHKLWEWGKEILTPEELNKMFLAKDIWGRTAWHTASERNK